MNRMVKILFLLAISLSLPTQGGTFKAENLITEKRYKDKIIGDGVTLQEIMFFADKEKTGKAFRIQVSKEGDYFLSCWASSYKSNQFDIFVDRQNNLSGKILFRKDGWQSCVGLDKTGITESSIKLQAGEHVIGFLGNSPAIPAVEFIKVGKTFEEINIPDREFNSRMALLKSTIGRSTENDTIVGLKDLNVSDKSLQVLTATASDPLYDYAASLNMPFKYTYRINFYFTQGSNVSFGCTNANISTVVYLFNYLNPTLSTSWVGSWITVSIPTTGYYMGVVRSYWWDEEGVGDIKFNNQIYATNVPITGCLFAAELMNSGTLNYFSASPESSSPYSKDTYIYASTWRKDSPIAAWNDDYSGSGDYAWGYLSRLKCNISVWPNLVNRAYIFASAYSSYSNGNADFYMMNEDCPSVASEFPNLEDDDAIKTAEASSNYNCISWSGGLTNLGRYFWPPDQYCPNNVWYDPDDYAAFSKFYGNTPTRFPGATTYTPTTNSAESFVDLWASSSTPPYENRYTHGSVKKPADNFTHGYDWESKPGGMARTMHPRSALGGSGGYGYIVKHFKPNTYASVATIPEETSKVLLSDVVALNEQCYEKLSNIESSIDIETKNKFDVLYNNWKKTWNSPELSKCSNPDEFYKSSQYDLFKSFCLKQDKSIAVLLFKKCLDGDELAGRAACVMRIVDKNGFIMEAVRNRSAHGTKTIENEFVVDSPQNGWVRFIESSINSEF